MVPTIGFIWESRTPPDYFSKGSVAIYVAEPFLLSTLYPGGGEADNERLPAYRYGVLPEGRCLVLKSHRKAAWFTALRDRGTFLMVHDQAKLTAVIKNSPEVQLSLLAIFNRFIIPGGIYKGHNLIIMSKTHPSRVAR